LKKKEAYKMAQKGKDRITTKDVEMAEKIIDSEDAKYQEDDAGEG
jgi:hypothetical protein